MIQVTVTQENLEYYLLILMRIASFMTLAPFFGQSNTPMRVKVGFSILVSYIVYILVPLDTAIPEYSSVIEYAVLVIKESITGLLIGFSAFICNTILQFSGRMMDMEIGMSMAQMFDPVTQSQVGLTGTLYSYLVFFLMLVSNMHIYLLNAVVDSFQYVPIGGISLGDDLYSTVTGFITNYFIIGFRIILPVFAITLILNCVLGIMAKVAPQMNMFAVGIQFKVIVGLLVMFATVRLLPSIANFIFDQMQQMVNGVIKGMM